MMTQSRRSFIQLASAAMMAGLTAARPSLAAEPPPETASIRLSRIPGVCIAPIYVAEDLLHAEGFTEVIYVDTQPGLGLAVDTGSGKVDFGLNFVTPEIVAIDRGEPLTLLGGVHPGCFELFVKPGIQTLLDLKGKSVGV